VTLWLFFINRKDVVATKKREVGTEVEAYCTKCKMDREHVISTLKSDGNINKVMCHTCEGLHLYRLPKSAKKKTPAKRRVKGAVIVSEADLKKAKTYSMESTFKAGDIIQHATFGPGSVVEIRPAGKMEVGFEFGCKTLVCGRKVAK
jgi:hypothetical protein